MENNRKHIDDFFKEELNDHQVPLSDDELSLFEESIVQESSKKFFLNPKYLKWLPYLAGLSAAAAIGYVSKPLFMQNKATVITENVKHITSSKTTRPIDTVTVSLPIINDRGQHKPIITPKTINIADILSSKTNKQLRSTSLLSPISLRQGSIIPNANGAKDINSLNKQFKVPFINTIYDELSLTLRLGAESGLFMPGITSGIFGLEMKYKVANNLYVGIQPGIKIGQSSFVTLPQRTTRYDNYSENVFFFDQQTIPEQYDYHYLETYDSISTSYALDRNIWEVELPVFWEYDLSKKVSLLAGVKLMYGKVPQIVKSTSSYKITNQDSLIDFPLFIPGNSLPLFEPQCNCLSDNVTQYQNPKRNVLRTGYMLGVKFKPVDKFSLDLTMHQNASDLSYIPNPNIRQLYNVTQFRISLGYSLNKK